MRLLAGKPLIQHTFETATASQSLDMVFLTTDIPEAIQLANEMGGIETPFVRPVHLCTDTASQVDVILHVLSYLEGQGKKVESFVILQPTAPFRTPIEIDQGVALLAQAESVIGVCEAIHHPADYLIEDENGKLEFMMSDFKGKRRQEFPTTYFNNGAFYACKAGFFKLNKVFYNKDSMMLKMNPNTIVDIDKELDLQLAETLIKQL